MPHSNEFKAEEIMDWLKTDSPILLVDTLHDTVPGGLAAAMMPLIVRWESSSPGFDENSFYLVKYINVGGNPVEGKSWLATVKIPGDAVESVEFVMVMEKVAHVETEGGHAMLRFIFRDDRLPQILGGDGKILTRHATIKDLLISWEAWRPPQAIFNPVKGLDPHTYALTARGSSGPARCLLDTVLDRTWITYPLALPGVENAGNELLYISLLLADAVARQTISANFKRHIKDAASVPEDYDPLEAEELERIRRIAVDAKTPENPIDDILSGKIRYHLLKQSCITMALQSIEWAAQRMHERGNLGERKSIRLAPESLPSVFDAMLSGKRTSTLLRLPAALHWLMMNQSVVPGKAYKLLDEAGLLQHEGGNVKRTHYDNRKKTPYGTLHEHIIH